VPFRGDNLVVVAMKHVTEHPPSVHLHRPDVPPRLARAVERALAKDPAQRFPSMDAFANELRRCRDDLGGLDADRTIVRGAPVEVPRPRPRKKTGRSRLPLILTLAGLVVAAAVVAAVIFGGSPIGKHDNGGGGSRGSGGGGPVAVKGVGNYDPQGNPDTHASTAAAATDGDASTDWYTQTYATPAFGNLKPGLGLVLDAGGTVKLKTLTVHTPTPGFVAQVRAGDSPSGPFSDDSSTQTVRSSTTFSLNGKSAEYYVIWISRLPGGGKAEISEVSAG